MIRAKINVTKIDKSKLFKGQKGTYLDIALIETPNNEFGDYMVVQELSREERLAGKKGPILGNAKKIVPRTQQRPVASSAPPEADEGRDDDSVPF